jgi:hypothetical protein
MVLPPEILCDVPGSFPESVLLQRHPAIIERVLAGHPYPPAIAAALRDVAGRVAEDVHLPFLVAENRFYRRLLDSVGFFAGPWRGVDPFGPQKAAELGRLDALPGDRDALVRASLLGNRADLGFGLLTSMPDDVDLVADDTADLWAHLDGTEPGHVCLLADNAGAELLADLLLVDHLLDAGLAASVSLHLKPMPWFVSDATTADLLATLARIGDTRPGERLAAALRNGRLTVLNHEFDCSPDVFATMPPDLREHHAVARLTIVKGDLNYRRLVEDRAWPATTPFAELTAYFPSPVLALRTLKSDLAVGLDVDRVASLDATKPGWRPSGHHAVIQFRA